MILNDIVQFHRDMLKVDPIEFVGMLEQLSKEIATMSSEDAALLVYGMTKFLMLCAVQTYVGAGQEKTACILAHKLLTTLERALRLETTEQPSYDDVFGMINTMLMVAVREPEMHVIEKEVENESPPPILAWHPGSELNN
jgi:hypothetical protein